MEAQIARCGEKQGSRNTNGFHSFDPQEMSSMAIHDRERVAADNWQ
jgi:hypothetical protein